jgi:CxxC-x17-CxxC domain-containing protein
MEWLICPPTCKPSFWKEVGRVSLTDKTLTCRDCGEEFLFTGGEQEFFQSKGLLHEPGRCPSCRANYKRERGMTSDRPVREYHDTVCADCGRPARVPFVPRNDRPVYCSSCYDKVRAASV